MKEMAGAKLSPTVTCRTILPRIEDSTQTVRGCRYKRIALSAVSRNELNEECSKVVASEVVMKRCAIWWRESALETLFWPCGWLKYVLTSRVRRKRLTHCY
jgi:hypothetical protein